LAETHATVIDFGRNDIDGTKESLMKMKDGTLVLLCACPSTARAYANRVPREIQSREQAQRWLHGDRKIRVVGAS
jgi:hypothetical protein